MDTIEPLKMIFCHFWPHRLNGGHFAERRRSVVTEREGPPDATHLV